MQIEKNHFPWGKISIILIFALLLTACRLLWMNEFNYTEKTPVITGGELDLRGWDFDGENPLTLAGEWKFYPDELLKAPPAESDAAKTIQVPGDWSHTLNPDTGSPYGAGTYYLRILTDPNQDASFSMRIASARSSSALYSNGLAVGKSGQPGEVELDATAFNAPYSSSSIRADQSGVIHIMLQVSNFIDPRSSGLVRSVKFGDEATVKAEVQLSTLLQVSAAVVFFVIALFAVIAYSVGFRDARILYFALLLIILLFINLTGGDEKVLFQYVPMNYVFSYKLSMFTLIFLSWSLVHCVAPQVKRLSKYILPAVTAYLLISTAVILVLPMEYLSRASNVTIGSVLAGAVLTIFALLYSKKTLRGGIWIALAITALASHYGWWAYSLGTGAKSVYYPFDLIIAVICLVGVWFNHYYNMSTEAGRLAVQLQKADREKDQFLAATSHELRNPLHGILNMSQAVLEREQPALQEKSIKNLETVLSVSRRMSLMLDELLEMSNLEKAEQTLHLQPISIQAIAEGVVDMLDYMTEGKPVRLINQIPNELPPVYADENRVTQIVFNLVHNAVKFTEHGEISISASVRDGYVAVSVEDCGIGIEPELLHTLFEPYIQGGKKTAGTGGFGLGLNISRKLAELHGGHLTVEADREEGSKFTFTLPAAESMTAVNEPVVLRGNQHTQPVKSADPLLFDENRPRVLVIDDEPVNLQVMEAIISPEEYNAAYVLSAEEALAFIDQEEWDLVISDVMMPKMSGYELARRIRRRFSLTELPILLLTARNSSEDIENGFLAGANDYVTKPVDAKELSSRIHALTAAKLSFRESLRMESAWLQAQIKPHFLYNTLNSIIALSTIDIERMRKLLIEFSNVLRGKFNFDNVSETVPLENELELIRSYVYIEKERFGERLQVQWEIDEQLPAVQIPALSIQPLVENAISHGILKRIEGGIVTIQITADAQSVNITVKDNGRGIPEKVLGKIRGSEQAGESGVGLLNVNLRLRRLYGEGLKITSSEEEGTAVSFAVPNGAEAQK